MLLSPPTAKRLKEQLPPGESKIERINKCLPRDAPAFCGARITPYFYSWFHGSRLVVNDRGDGTRFKRPAMPVACAPCKQGNSRIGCGKSNRNIGNRFECARGLSRILQYGGTCVSGLHRGRRTFEDCHPQEGHVNRWRVCVTSLDLAFLLRLRAARSQIDAKDLKTYHDDAALFPSRL